MTNINLLIGFVGLVLGVIGILVSFVLANDKKKPLYATRTTSLGFVTHQDLGITFKGRYIPNVYAIRFVFFNGGRKEIRKEDIPLEGAGPTLKISKSVEILTFYAQTTTGDNSGSLLDLGENAYAIHFDYLNKYDAVFGEIICTSLDESRPVIDLSGAIKGARLKVCDVHNLYVIDHIFFIFVALLMAFLTFVFGKSSFDAYLKDNRSNMIVNGIISLICAGLFSIDVWGNILTIPRKLPKQYDRFLSTGEMLQSKFS